MDPDAEQRLARLEKQLGYTFRDRELLITALTHSSYANEHHTEMENNERFEFLGDAVVGLVISETVFRRFPDENEGFLTTVKHYLVESRSLALLARQLGVDGALLLGKGEEQQGGRQRPGLLEDAMEAVICAVFLDGGYPAALKTVQQIFTDLLKTYSPEKQQRRDAKTPLQQLAQADGLGWPEYAVVSEEGAAHEKHFVCSVAIAGVVLAAGAGRSKKDAEQKAAANLLHRLETENTDLVSLLKTEV